MDVDNLRVTGGCVPIIKGSHFSAFLGKPMPACWKRNNVDTMWNSGPTFYPSKDPGGASLFTLHVFTGVVFWQSV